MVSNAPAGVCGQAPTSIGLPGWEVLCQARDVRSSSAVAILKGESPLQPAAGDGQRSPSGSRCQDHRARSFGNDRQLYNLNRCVGACIPRPSPF